MNSQMEPILPKNRSLKQSISKDSTDRTDNDINPVQTNEMKSLYENQLIDEIKQWPAVFAGAMKREENKPHDGFDNLLKPDQRAYLDATVSGTLLIQESNEFRKKMQFFILLKTTAQRINSGLKENAKKKYENLVVGLESKNFHTDPFVEGTGKDIIF